MFRLLLLCLCAALCCGRQHHDDWTDPTDMFNYDAAAGKMIKQKHNTEEKVEGVCEKAGEDSCSPGSGKALVTHIEKPKETDEHKLKEVLKSPDCHSNPVFRRFLRKVLSEAARFGLPEDASSEVYYNSEMVLTKQMVAEIQKFIDDEDWNLGALEEALVRILVQFRHHNVKEWWAGIFEDYIGIDIGTTLKILLCVACIVTIMATELWSCIGWFTQLKRLCIISFFVSVAWNWMYLYKVAFAERQAEMAKRQEFDGCIGKLSWSENLIEWWRGVSVFRNDPCEEYYKALMINPVLMVSPTKALALTLTDFVTEPLKHLGKALGEFFNGFLAEIPAIYQLLVLIIIAAIILVSCYGASTTIGHVLVHRNDRQPNMERLPPAEERRERLPPAEERRERLLPAEPSWTRLPPAEERRETLPPTEPSWTRLPPAEPSWTRLPPAETPWERLPPAEPLRPHYGNVIEGWRPPPYYIQPPYGPVYSHPPNWRPENLQAVDVPYDGSHRLPPGLTEMDSHSRHQDGAGERRKEEVAAKQKPLGEQGGKTAEESSEGKYARREEPKERPRQRENEPIVGSSFTEMQKKEDPPEQKSTKCQRKADSIEETNNSTQQRNTESVHSKEQMKEEHGDQNAYGGRPRGEEPPHERSSGLQQRREASVEEISHGEPSWVQGGAPEDKSLEQTGASNRNPSERKFPREEATEEIDEYEDEYEYEYEYEDYTYNVEEEEEESSDESEEETVIRVEESEKGRALMERLRKRAQELGYTDLPSFQDDPQWPSLEDVPKDSNYDHPRIGNTSWCGCHNCKPMETRDESNCCVEEPALKRYFDQGLTCILEHNELKELRFDEKNLELMVEFGGRESAREIKKDRNRVIRKAAYRAYSCFAHGITGPSKGMPIPSCIVDYIRGVYPDPEGAPMRMYAPNDYPAADMAADV